MKRILITTCLIFTFVFLEANPLSSKESDASETPSISATPVMNPPRRYIYPEWGFFIDGSAGYSLISNPNLSSSIWDPKGNLGATFYIGYFHTINPNMRLLAGLGASYFTSSISGDGEAPQKEFKDIDNDTYTETLTLSNAETRQIPIYVSIPLIFEYGNVSITRPGYYVDFGLKYSYMINNNSQSSGYYSTKGTYQQWGVTLEDVEELGFYSERDLESNTNFKRSDLAVLGGVGITLPISSVVILKLGLVANLGLLDIGNNKPNKSDSGPITSDVYNYRAKYIDNTLAVTKGTRTKYFGLELGIYINKQLK
ncbi:MAG: hypothetical protein R2757_08180 [Draconibacterium sp.]